MANVWVLPQFLSPSKYYMKLLFGSVLFCSLISLIFLRYVYANSTSPDEAKAAFIPVQTFHDPNGLNQGPLELQSQATLPMIHAVWNTSEIQYRSEIPVMMPFVNAHWNSGLQDKFKTSVSSMVKLSSAPIVLYLVADKESQKVAAALMPSLGGNKVRMVMIDVDLLGKEMESMVHTMQQHFSYKPGSYYSHTLFFLSTAIHRLAPPSLHRLIMLDIDLLFKADIKRLFELFDSFSPSNIIGIGYDLQPVYRHVLWEYRRDHPGTRLGSPKPGGLQGFNSGVLLLDLDQMRASDVYNKLLDAKVMKDMAQKYSFKGHLGDQDFYTLLSFEHEELFYVLPCAWNRQLCQWWKDKGYEDVFDQYFSCDEQVNIYHGNCNTPFPLE